MAGFLAGPNMRQRNQGPSNALLVLLILSNVVEVTIRFGTLGRRLEGCLGLRLVSVLEDPRGNGFPGGRHVLGDVGKV